jgi:hypothetical protein
MSNKEEFVPKKRKTNKQWARAATKVVGGNLSQYGKTADGVYLRRVWVGIVKENCPDLAYKNIVGLAGLDVSHSTIHQLFAKWQELPWRVRHGWLMMAEAAVQGDIDWSPSAWHQELHELSLMSLEEKVKVTPWHQPVARLRRPVISGGGYGSVS